MRKVNGENQEACCQCGELKRKNKTWRPPFGADRGIKFKCKSLGRRQALGGGGKCLEMSRIVRFLSQPTPSGRLFYGGDCGRTLLKTGGEREEEEEEGEGEEEKAEEKLRRRD